MRLCRRLSCPKVLLALSNVTLMACACALMAAGVFLYLDNRRLLISKLLGATNEVLAELPQPMFYYFALGLAGSGLIGLFASILGCWANCWTNYCTLTLYFLVVFILLIGEFVISISITLWPNCLGLNLDEESMTSALTSQYGIPGNEQYTAAIDLAQTRFACCGIGGNVNYDQSVWQSKNYVKKSIVVPLTCCTLDNVEEYYAYLDPQPSNLTVCQSIVREEYVKGRHTKSCLAEVQLWYQWHYLVFIGIVSVVALVYFFVLLTIIFSCTNLKRERRKTIDQHIAEFERKVNDRRSIMNTNTTSTSSLSPRSSPVNIPDRNQLQEFNCNRPRCMASLRASAHSDRMGYRIGGGGTKAYLE